MIRLCSRLFPDLLCSSTLHSKHFLTSHYLHREVSRNPSKTTLWVQYGILNRCSISTTKCSLNKDIEEKNDDVNDDVKSGTYSNSSSRTKSLDNPHDSSWYQMLEQLSTYHKNHKHTNVPVEHPTLGYWVKNQRNQYNRNNMPQHRIEALLDLGFQFKPLEKSWDNMLQELKNYKEKYGHVNVPMNYPPNPVLGRWVSTQRKEYKKYLENQISRMNQERRKRLEDLGFIFDALEHTWQNNYELLRKYIKTHGDSNVPKKYEQNSSLGTWVQTQRTNYKLWKENPQSFCFPRHRREALDDLNFVWDFYETGWNAQFSELERFHAAHGHCLVPFSYESNPSLGIWVATQRKQYILWKKNKPCKLTPERREKLDQLGFVWDVRAAKWQERFEELADFMSVNGHSIVPDKSGSLRKWVNTQRHQHSLWKAGKPTRLTEERREMLNKIGFQWKMK